MGFINRLEKRFNNRKWGIVIGLFFPIIALIILWQWNLSEKSLSGFLKFLNINASLRDNFLIFSLLPNLILFYFSNFRFRFDRFTTGLVFATVILTLIVSILILL